MFLQWVSAGALRLPDGPKKPLSLKPVERKPLESVVRYLGKKKKLSLTVSLFFQVSIFTGCVAGFGWLVFSRAGTWLNIWKRQSVCVPLRLKNQNVEK